MSATSYPAAGTKPRVMQEIGSLMRSLAGAAAVVSLGYAGVLAWRPETDGIATAALFAVGFLLTVFALTGAVPSSIKVGDFEMGLEQARKAGEAAGVQGGLTAVHHLADRVTSGQLSVSDATECLQKALTSPEDLLVCGTSVAVPQLQDDHARELVAMVQRVLTQAAAAAAPSHSPATRTLPTQRRAG